ncbi:MAG: chemotaxis protein CheX [Candidatus Zixiibacteriota bacterium]
MIKVLFISNQTIAGRTLANQIGREFQVDTVDFGQATEADDYAAIVCDLEVDTEKCSEEVARLRAVCSYRDVSIMVAASDGMVREARKMAHVGASGILRKPFCVSRTLAELKRNLRPVGVRTEIKLETVEPFIDGTVDVIKKMTDQDVTRQDLYLKRSYYMSGDISGVMRLSGDTEGVVAIAFRKDLASSLVARMVSCDESELSIDDIMDGIGEIINIISGTARTALSENGSSFDISLPAVVTGYGHQIVHKKEQPLIVVVFDCDGCPFVVELCVSSATPKQSGSKESEAIKDAVPC